jgi:endonuclease/exonuclease/phosphatase family metal-dependent hydrolase
MQIKIMSFNIRYENPNDGINIWQNRREFVFDIIKKYQCDFVCMQEVTVNQLSDSIKNLPQYTFIARSRNIDNSSGESVPIAFVSDKWKALDSGFFWLSDTPDVPASRSFGNALPRITTWTKFTNIATNKTILLYNTHFDHESSTAQCKSAELLIKHISSNRLDINNIIITGDFNVEFENRAIKVLLSSDLKLMDTSVEYRKKFPRFGTFHEWTGNTSQQIDFIFSSSTIKFLDFQVIKDCYGSNKYPSDHFPVISKLEIE